MASDMRIGASPEPEPGPQVDQLAWWFIVMAMCAVVVACGFSGVKSGGGGLAYQAGVSLPYAGLMAAALHMVLKRTRVGSQPWLGFFVLYLAWLAASAVAVVRVEKESRAALAGMGEALDAAYKAREASGPVDISALTGPSKAKGDAGTLEALFKGVFKQSLALQKEYEEALAKAGLGRLLDAQRIQKDKSMEETRALIAESRRVVSVYRQRGMSVFDEVARQIEATPMDDQYRRDAMVGYQRAAQQSREFAARSWDQELAQVDQMGQLAEMLGASRARWQVRGGQFTFFKSSDLEEFNRRMSALQKLATEQQAEHEARMRQARERMQR